MGDLIKKPIEKTQEFIRSDQQAKGKAPQDEDLEAVRKLAQNADQLFQSTLPLRESLIGRSQDFLEGNLDVVDTPQFGAIKSAADQQFRVVRDRAIERGAVGGALTDTLSNIDVAQANFLTQGAGTIAEQEINRAVSTATGNPLSTSLGGLGNAGMIQQQAAQAAAAQRNQTKQGVGAGAGALFGGKGGG